MSAKRSRGERLPLTNLRESVGANEYLVPKDVEMKMCVDETVVEMKNPACLDAGTLAAFFPTLFYKPH